MLQAIRLALAKTTPISLDDEETFERQFSEANLSTPWEVPAGARRHPDAFETAGVNEGSLLEKFLRSPLSAEPWIGA